MQRCSHFSVGPFTLLVWHDEQAIFQSRLSAEPQSVPTQESSHFALAKQIQNQLDDYLAGQRRSFELPLQAQGTPFQKQVWQLMQSIPCGQTLTYGDAAKHLQSAAQPVGGACRANPIAFFIPCHRIVSRQGIGGYAGQWGQGERVDMKSWLLAHERSIA
ncbi:methylated-DNA--[protein]-cysteine S-methyltransferase [Aliidiomarina soli]|uniref:Methylated-DNA-[protein]-cysteine S-methyltransferase DNA binding domain-containing protein n=1 Tax=Aliidiomarina soli TaxID=1928574 RepID=A0A432WLJ3_9GAMM|nr:methylated-DNA--[protein]-cysteine S-methyltransferase [Aliidiomarina soli]RUO34680.1 hypothetical protein CWE14_01365 [Aliidiomarina soli]